VLLEAGRAIPVDVHDRMRPPRRWRRCTTSTCDAPGGDRDDRPPGRPKPATSAVSSLHHASGHGHPDSRYRWSGSTRVASLRMDF